MNRLIATARRSHAQNLLRGWFETARGENRSMAMEGLRGLAILLVFLCHFQMVVLSHLASAFHSRVAIAGAEIGGTGVDLFFLLSGMLIYRAAMRPNLRYLQFLARRVQRIYPTFLAVLVFYLVLSLVFHQGEHYEAASTLDRFRYIAANLFLLPGIVDLPPVISAAWSLSYEFSFYLVLPLLVRVLRVPLWSRRSRVLFWFSLSAMYLVFALTHASLFPERRFQDASFVRFTLFLSGMIVEDVLQTERSLRWLSFNAQIGLLTVAAAALALLFVTELRTVSTTAHHGIEHAVVRASLVTTMYVALCLSTLQPRGILARIVSHTTLRWTGNVSYSFYLIHGFVLNVVATILVHLAWTQRHPSVSAPLLLVIAFASTFAVASALFLAVEKPFSLAPRRSRITRELPPGHVTDHRKHVLCD